MALATVKPFAIAANGNAYVLDVLPNATVKRFSIAGSAFTLDVLTNITAKKFAIAGSAFELEALEEEGGGSGISTEDLEEEIQLELNQDFEEDEIEDVSDMAVLTDDADIIDYATQFPQPFTLQDVLDTVGSEYFADLEENIEVSDDIDSFKIITADLEDSLLHSDAADALGEYLSDLEDQLGISLEDETEGVDGLETWVVNTTSGGISKYRWRRFTSFAQNNRSVYGIDPDGIYLVGTDDDDDGEQIDAYVTLRKDTLGVIQKKRMFAAYVNMASNGPMRFKVYADDQTYKYEITLTASYATTKALEMARAVIGRGLRATNWIFEIQNVDGADFEVESVNVYPVVLDRRVR